MAAIPQSTRNSITLRLLDHAERHWPQLTRVQVTYRGAFGYITGVLRDGQRLLLCRLRCGSAHSFGFAIYSAASNRYQDAVLRTGLPAGIPQEALDTACTVHFTGLGHEPDPGSLQRNLRRHPLNLPITLPVSLPGSAVLAPVAYWLITSRRERKL
jgi:hypothetical protein